MAVKPAGSSNNQLLKWATKIAALVGAPPAAGSITNAMLADMAASRFKARNSGGGTGPPEDLTGTQATALLDLFSSTLKGLVPLSGGGTTNFLRADGAFAAAGLAAATQAEQEAASSTTVAVTPGRQHFHPSSPKAWGTVTYVAGVDAPALQDTYNVTSLTDGATTDTQFNFTVAFSNATYCAIGGANSGANAGIGSGGRAAGNILVTHTLEATTSRITMICLGDQ
jgi:hypothetical protein